MPESETKQYSDSIGWQVESFRLTTFLSPSDPVSERDWFKILTSEEPDRRTSEPKIGLQQEEGKFKDGTVEGNLVVTIHPTRIDLQLIPLMNNLGFEIPTIGLFEESFNSFQTLMLRWIQHAPMTQRLAFGAVLYKSVSNSKEGYHFISSFIPFDLDEDSSEFLYQINRPRKSLLDGLTDLSINRLSKWSVSLFTLFFNPNNVLSPTVNVKHAVRLELDVNTTPNFTRDLPSSQLPNIFIELLEIGKEIAIKGDIK
jgi:hypothetical protein